MCHNTVRKRPLNLPYDGQNFQNRACLYHDTSAPDKPNRVPFHSRIVDTM